MNLEGGREGGVKNENLLSEGNTHSGRCSLPSLPPYLMMSAAFFIMNVIQPPANTPAMAARAVHRTMSGCPGEGGREGGREGGKM